MHFHSSVGTQTAMENFTLIAAGPEYFTVAWNPKYSPISIEQYTQCKSVCDVKPYYRSHSFIPVETNSLIVADLKPGSICKMRMLALFNPALLDSGIKHVFRTLPSSKWNAIGPNLPSILNIQCIKQQNYRGTLVLLG